MVHYCNAFSAICILSIICQGVPWVQISTNGLYCLNCIWYKHQTTMKSIIEKKENKCNVILSNILNLKVTYTWVLSGYNCANTRAPKIFNHIQRIQVFHIYWQLWCCTCRQSFRNCCFLLTTLMIYFVLFRWSLCCLFFGFWLPLWYKLFLLWMYF